MLELKRTLMNSLANNNFLFLKKTINCEKKTVAELHETLQGGRTNPFHKN